MSDRYFFFDLDGPILDVSEKYYQVYKDILEGLGFHVIGKDQYWQMKRAKVPEKNILALTHAEDSYQHYRTERKKIIETSEYLKWDRVHEKAHQVLDDISGRFTTVLVTLRSNPHQLHVELKNLGLEKYFSKVLSADGDQPEKWTIKRDLIQNEFGKMGGKNYFMGDTETDIMAGKALGCLTIGVLSGIRNESIIRSLSPTFVVSAIEDLIEKIKIE